MSYYPICVDLTGRAVVIIGGGAVAARKVRSLTRYGARVIVVAPRFSEELRDVTAERIERPFEPHHLDGAALVFAATDDAAVNAAVAAECRARRIPVNVADDTELCDFIVPAVVERGSIQLAISTGGKSPALARRLKADLQDAVGDEYAEMNDILGALREPAKRSPKLPEDADRRRFFEELLDSGVLELLRAGRREEAQAIIRSACAAAGIGQER